MQNHAASGDTGRAERIAAMAAVNAATDSVIRAYDLKAEIAMLSFVLSVEAVNVLSRLEHVRTASPRLSGLLVILFLAAVVAYIYVLLPRSTHRRSTGFASRGVLFVDPMRHETVDGYLKALQESDLEREAAHQVLELADICAVKRGRFVAAVSLTGVFYALLLVACLTA